MKTTLESHSPEIIWTERQGWNISCCNSVILCCWGHQLSWQRGSTPVNWSWRVIWKNWENWKWYLQLFHISLHLPKLFASWDLVLIKVLLLLITLIITTIVLICITYKDVWLFINSSLMSNKEDLSKTWFTFVTIFDSLLHLLHFLCSPQVNILSLNFLFDCSSKEKTV